MTSFKQGMEQLIESLSKDPEIRVETPIESLSKDKTGWQLQTGQKQVAADHRVAAGGSAGNAAVATGIGIARVGSAAGGGGQVDLIDRPLTPVRARAT